jgi:hypothetical protein
MLVFPSLIAQAAIDAGMKVPSDPDEYEVTQFPHWTVFCMCQLGRAMSPGAHWENAKVVAAVPEDQILQVTFEQLEERGWVH